MKKRLVKSIIGILLVFSMGLHTIIPAFASESTCSRDEISEESKDLISKIITFYGGEYRPDVIKHLAELKEKELEYSEIWDNVIRYWDWIEMEMIENINVAPNGIKNPQKHAFIVLGFALNVDGTMTDELIGRLEVAKASAEKYPESYILVTGGVEKNGWTEGRRMRDWLLENGIDEDRIIVEEKAPDTAGNATNSFEMLYQDYDVDTVSLITTQYHLKRGSILYYAESLLKAKELGVKPITFIGEANAGWYRADKTMEDLSLKASSLRSIARVSSTNVSGMNTILSGLKVIGEKEYVQGDDLDITVTSIDSKNYNVDLTKYTVVKGFDTNVIGEKTITISYTQNNKVYESTFNISIAQTPDNLIDKARLGSLIKANEDRNLQNYTRKTGTYLLDKVAEAKVVFQNDKATQDEIITTYKKLNSAVTKLVELTNVAKNKNVEANYNQQDAYKITDGIINTGNYWASMDGSKNAPIEKSNFIIDLDDNYNIDTLKMFPYWGGSRYYHYDIYVSTDRKEWTKVVEERSENFCTSAGSIYRLETMLEARYIKVQGVKTYVAGRDDINNFHVIELQVFGEELDYDVLHALDKLQILYDGLYQTYEEANYTNQSWVIFSSAMNDAKEILTYGIATLEEISSCVKNLENAKNSLTYRDADYSKVDAAIAKANLLTKKDYKNFSLVETAITNVVRGKNITEQKEVDAMANAIENAILQLEKPSVKPSLSNNTSPSIQKKKTVDTGNHNSMELWFSMILFSSIVLTRRIMFRKEEQ